MRVNFRLRNLLIKAMVESMSVNMMVTLIRHFVPFYNIHESAGFPENMSIPKRDAARQVVSDIIERGLVLQFAEHLIVVHTEGLMGRDYAIPRLREILSEIHDAGFIFDREHGAFIEDSRVRKTRNWGTLLEGREYGFSFLSLDVVGNTALVRGHSEQDVRAAYGDLFRIVQRSIERREGRLWDREGDGGLAAFHFGKKYDAAVLSAIDILHELFLYNRLECKLDSPLSVRLAVHGGPCEYRNNIEDIVSDTIARTLEIEANHTRPDTVTISNVVYLSLDPLLQEMLMPVDSEDYSMLHAYELRWEGP